MTGHDTSHSNVGMSVSLGNDNTCTARIEHVTEIMDKTSSEMSNDTQPSVSIEHHGKPINTLEEPEGEVVLGETIFCR